MNINKSALGFSGLFEWLLLRITSILILFYFFYLFYFFFFTEIITYDIWCKFFSDYITKILTLVFLFSVLIHCCIGLWQICTDYINNKLIRNFLFNLIRFLLFIYMFYGIIVIFGV